MTVETTKPSTFSTELFDPRDLCDALGTFATGVTIVTAMMPTGEPIGFTANSFTSVSLEPPLILVCIANRAIDWAEVRPEWALAGCKAFIAAPRSRSVGQKLDGRAFLHDYDWTQDSENGFGVLELIMTAPVVVASWISLQYYGSTVAPETLGSGNKLLHNVVGGVGVFEGNGGNLRAGLPWQSVHDGDDFAHEPLRLTVCVEAPIEAMTDILKRHEGVRHLFDNHWLHLLAMDGEGKPAHRYGGNLIWEPSELTDAI